jgi:hypothetical protein
MSLMIWRCPIHVHSLRISLFAGLLIVSATRAPAQQSGGHPFEGEWSLVLEIATAPGGATLTFAGTTTSPYNYAVHAAKPRFEVHEDGSFEWSQSDAGSSQYDGVQTNSTGTARFRGSQNLLLRAVGKAQAPRAAGRETRAEDRRLTLDLTMVHGSGYYSVAGSLVTATTAISNTAQVPARLETWADLKPTRVIREELAPDVIRETTTYEGTRPTNNAGADSGSVPPTTERIKVQQVRYLNLISRG